MVLSSAMVTQDKENEIIQQSLRAISDLRSLLAQKNQSLQGYEAKVKSSEGIVIIKKLVGSKNPIPSAYKSVTFGFTDISTTAFPDDDLEDVNEVKKERNEDPVPISTLEEPAVLEEDGKITRLFQECVGCQQSHGFRSSKNPKDRENRLKEKLKIHRRYHEGLPWNCVSSV
jgi:hypothetical protein